jgi:hypothetical protein
VAHPATVQSATVLNHQLTPIRDGAVLWTVRNIKPNYLKSFSGKPAAPTKSAGEKFNR